MGEIVATSVGRPVRLLVTGAAGQLGSELLAAASASGTPARGLTAAELDITDQAAVRRAVGEFAAESAAESAADGGSGRERRPVLINAAAYTAVDAAEADHERAHAVNATGPGYLAAAAAAHGVGFIHVSTDYVFPGDATSPYEVDDATGPRSVYGKTKLAGELAVVEAHPGAQIVRTAWVYGATGSNFVKTMAALEASRDTVSVVDDQRGSPTWSADLAGGLIELAGADVAGGILHATNGGETTWHGLAAAVFAAVGADPARVLPTTSDAFVRPAPRPAYSVLSGRAWKDAGLTPLPDWKAALAAAFRSHGAELAPARLGSGSRHP